MSERLTKKHTTTIITSDSNGRVSGTQTVSNTYRGQNDETVISTRSRGKSFFGHVKAGLSKEIEPKNLAPLLVPLLT